MTSRDPRSRVAELRPPGWLTMLGGVMAAITFVVTLNTATIRYRPPRATTPHRVNGNDATAHIQASLIEGSYHQTAMIVGVWLEDDPDATFGLMCGAVAHERLGEPEAARALWTRLKAATPDFENAEDPTDRALHRHAWALWGLGESSAARTLWRRHADAMRDDLNRLYTDDPRYARLVLSSDEEHGREVAQMRGLISLQLYHISNSRAMAGQRDLALEALEEAIDRDLPRTFQQLGAWMTADPDLDPLRGDPCFEALLQRAQDERPRPTPDPV